MSGGANAIAGAIERQHRRLLKRCGKPPALFMTGGAAVKLAPITDLDFQTVESLIFDGLLCIQSKRLAL
jgi:type III pantothenate kinase